jgi:uncharacterized Zn-finger protein
VGQIELLRMQSYPKFHSESGVPIVRVGCREFKCVGVCRRKITPDIYFSMGDAGEILYPY